MPDNIYWDVCLFIDLLQQNDLERFDACNALREKALKQKLVILTSALTISEDNN